VDKNKHGRKENLKETRNKKECKTDNVNKQFSRTSSSAADI
jgi:hypothetical protein